MRLIVGVWWLIPAVASLELALLKYKQPYGPKMCALLCEGSSNLLCSFSATELSCKVFGKARAVVAAAANSSSELNRTLCAELNEYVMATGGVVSRNLRRIHCGGTVKTGFAIPCTALRPSDIPEINYCEVESQINPDYVFRFVSTTRVLGLHQNEKKFVSRDGKIHFNQHFEKRTWDAALRICQSEGGSLIKIKTPEKETVIIHNIDMETPFIGEDFVWIGLKDISDTNTFVWTDNSSLTYNLWGGGQPSNVSKGRAGSHPEDCVALASHIVMGVFWDDRSCSERSKFLCETIE